MTDVEVGAEVIVKDAPTEIVKWCRERYAIKNPDFYKKQKMGKWTGGTPEVINLYAVHGGDLILPFGCLKSLHKAFGKNLKYDIKFAESEAKYRSNISLYDYQEKAVEAVLNAKNGVLVMPCGSGKTQCGLEVIARLGKPALWLTHTQDLLNQSMARAKSVLDSEPYGVITCGKVDIGKSITFATVQTLCNVDLDKIKDQWGVIIVDECQHACGSPTKITQFYKVLSRLSARYKIGLTATPRRADGLEVGVFALLGDIIYEVSKDDVKDTTCPIIVKKYYTGYVPNYDAVLLGDGTIDYSRLVDAMINDDDRFQYVLNMINDLDGSAIVLGNRVDYIKRLNDACSKKSVCISAMGQTRFAKEVRKKVLNQLNDGRIDVIFATYQLAKEGLDVPSLRYIVFATPEKDETTITQSVGRVGRKFDGKECGIVIDLIDDFGMYKGWAKKRDRCYKKLDAEVVDCHD